MSALFVILFSIIIFLIAYVTYGSWLAKKWGVDPSRKTPAHELEDGVDYVPASAPVVLGHHFASIAGAGPIIGPIAAAVFGWIPVVLWIIVGTIFVGGVQDFGALFASVRHDGKSMGEVIGVNIGEKGKKLYAIFAWLTLLLVIAAFVNVVANTFVAVPEAATASLLFMILALGFGYAVYRKGVDIKIASVIGVILLVGCIALGNMFPLVLAKNVWIGILLAYIFVASVTPVWILLQPRDYLNSFLLYAMIVGAVIGIAFARPTMELTGFTGFTIGNLHLFPMLFVIVACGAISGFHSLVGSGTTSKQLDNERDTKIVGYGAMLIEGVLAIIAIITAAYLTGGRLTELLGAGGPINVFSDGIGNFMTSFGVPFNVGKAFIALAISAFALTTLDTATRLARFLFQEFFLAKGEVEGGITNRYVATGITVVLGGGLALVNWRLIWPIFGSANQLLAAMSLLALSVWLKSTGKDYKMTLIPMVFMFIVTLSALALLIQTNFIAANYLLVVVPAILFVLALILIHEAYKVMSKSGTGGKIES